MAQKMDIDEARPSDVQIIGANIYRLRHPPYAPMISRERLAEMSGVSVETIRRLETARGGRELGGVQLAKLTAIARALGVETGELLRWDERTRVYLHGEGPDLQLIRGGLTERRRTPERRALAL